MADLTIDTSWRDAPALALVPRHWTRRLRAHWRLHRLNRRQASLQRALGEADLARFDDLGVRRGRRDWLAAFLAR